MQQDKKLKGTEIEKKKKKWQTEHPTEVYYQVAMATGLSVEHDFRKNTVQTIQGDELPRIGHRSLRAWQKRQRSGWPRTGYLMPAVITPRSAIG